jgi:predicted metal-dependent phosphoesterase TrpH
MHRGKIMVNRREFGRADLHMHTTASDGLATVQDLLDHVAQRGHLDVIAITDHDILEASLLAYEQRDRYPFDIIPGVEVSSLDGHVLGLWVTQPIPMGLSLAETTAAIHDQGGVSILAHPFHVQLSDVYRNVWRYLWRPAYLIESGIDGLEVYNAGGLIPGCNTWARRVAHKLGLAATAGSDAHNLGAIGCGVTYFPGRTADDLRQAIVTRQTRTAGHHWSINDYLEIISALPKWQAPTSVREYLRVQETDIKLASGRS